MICYRITSTNLTVLDKKSKYKEKLNLVETRSTFRSSKVNKKNISSQKHSEHAEQNNKFYLYKL